jgi:hypothetical protein
MFTNGKMFAILIGVLVAIFALISKNSNPVVEGWNWGALTVTTQPGLQNAQGMKTAAGGNYNPLMGSGKFVSVPSYQAVLAPRFNNNNYGAYIRYNLPDNENLAVPCNPLTFGDMAKENYAPGQQLPQQSMNYQAHVQQPVQENFCNGTGNGAGCTGGTASCGKGGYGMGHAIAGGYDLPSNYTNGNYADVYNSLPGPVVSQACNGESSGDLPIGSMTTMDSNGNPEQYVSFNRYMTAPLKNLKRSLGDHIRGDLAITPCNTGWFSVYPTPSVDLNPGALNVLNGNGDSNAKLMQLLTSSAGGARTTFGGVNLEEPVNMTPQMSASLSSAMTDVNISSFP